MFVGDAESFVKSNNNSTLKTYTILLIPYTRLTFVHKTSWRRLKRFLMENELKALKHEKFSNFETFPTVNIQSHN